MKTIPWILPLLTCMATAADLTYKGADGGWFEVAGNWVDSSTGVPASAVPASGDTLLISDNHSVKLGNNKGNHTFNNVRLTLDADTSLSVDGAYGYAFNNSSLTIKTGATLNASATVSGASSAMELNGSTVTIEKGGTMNLYYNPKVGYATTTFNVYGKNGLTFGNTWTDVVGKQAYTFNLFREGSVSLGTLHPGASLDLTLTGTLNATAVGSGEITLQERVLLTFDGIAGTLPQQIFSDQCSFSALDGTALTLSSEDLSAKTILTEEDLNTYNLIFRDNAVIVRYASRLVPEPATASLSLLALAGWALRRRRQRP